MGRDPGIPGFGIPGLESLTVTKKTVQNYCSQNLITFLPTPTVKNFWHKDGKGDKLYVKYTHFPPHLFFVYASVLNADVPNCYITL